MKTIIKWPGGKGGEINKFINLIPEYDRYIEPFFGGGAVYFHIEPKKAIINDISQSLMMFYKLVKKQDRLLYNYLIAYSNSMEALLVNADNNYNNILKIYNKFPNVSNVDLRDMVENIIEDLIDKEKIVLDNEKFINIVLQMVIDKFERTKNNNLKKPFSEEDMKENLITGFMSGYYMYFRSVYNELQLEKIIINEAYKVANFYYIREYCYGSMFRYNKKGEFNIPYGGISYNKKRFNVKINSIFNDKMKELFNGTEIYSLDFEDFFNNISLTKNDFIFLDPPYDTEFSDYEGRSFDKEDQKRLADVLKGIKAKFILVIKNTDYIYNLYKDNFHIISFDKNYTYNVRSRNDRDVEHLIITNIE